MSARTGGASLGLVLMLSLAGGAAAQDYRTVSGSRQRRGESQLNATIEFAVGDLRVSPGPAGSLYRYDLVYDADKFDPVAIYNPNTQRLRLGVDGKSHGDYNYRDRPRQRLDLSLSQATPVSLRLTFGAGTAEVELGGLSLTDAAVKGGASQTTIRFSQPNKVPCRRLTLEVGAVDLNAEKLGNARCERIELKGAAGNVVLDLTGDWARGTSTELAITVGFGSVTLRLPESLGVEADVERLLVNFDRSGLLRRGSSYYSANWESASSRLHLDLKAVLGDVQLEWVK